MDKEPNINIWKEISANELVLDASKVEQKYEKQQRKTSLRAVGGTRRRRELKINVTVKIKKKK